MLSLLKVLECDVCLVSASENGLCGAYGYTQVHNMLGLFPCGVIEVIEDISFWTILLLIFFDSQPLLTTGKLNTAPVWVPDHEARGMYSNNNNNSNDTDNIMPNSLSWPSRFADVSD